MTKTENTEKGSLHCWEIFLSEYDPNPECIWELIFFPQHPSCADKMMLDSVYVYDSNIFLQEDEMGHVNITIQKWQSKQAK